MTPNKAGKWLLELKTKLTPIYTPPAIAGGHDVTHVLRMEHMFPRMRKYFSRYGMVNREEYIAAVWLHNLDRSSLVSPQSHDRTKTVCEEMLSASPFDYDAQSLITDAVLQHSKWDDHPEDSILLQALRLADKTDRIGIIGIICGAAFRGSRMLPYNPDDPFLYQALAETDMKTLFHDYWRILEWWPKYPQLREFVGEKPIFQFINFVREYAAHIAESHCVPNTVEENIAKALGTYYQTFSPAQLGQDMR